jgi:hypothetical protein
MKTDKEYIEAAAVVFALDKREEDAKEILRAMSREERRRLIVAFAELGLWISQIECEPIVGALPDGTFHVKK